MKGTRVQSIIRELRGEKIDIVEWSDDPTTFVLNALSPAKVSRVSIVDEEQRIMEVVVEDKQLSLAIGKKGQNVRLAAKIVGWRIDIKSEEEKRREVEAEMARMARAVDEIRSLERARRGREDRPEAGRGRHPRASRTSLEMTDEELGAIEGVGPEDGREDPRGRGAGQARVGRARRRGGGRAGGGGAGAAEQAAADAGSGGAGRGRAGRGRAGGGRAGRGAGGDSAEAGAAERGGAGRDGERRPRRAVEEGGTDGER